MNATFRAALIEQVKGANPDIDEKDLTFDFELDEADIATASSRVTDGDNSHWSGPQAGATSVVVCIRGDQVLRERWRFSSGVFAQGWTSRAI